MRSNFVFDGLLQVDEYFQMGHAPKWKYGVLQSGIVEAYD